MAPRKQLQSTLTVSPELQKALDEARLKPVTEEEFQEQRISFAFGNAMEEERITKESVRRIARNILLK